MVAQIDATYMRLRPTKLLSRLVSYALFEGRPLTTRGRWINPLLFAHFSLEKHLPQLKRVKKPIFILGTGRSGTTILGIVLSMHRDIGFLNEPKALWHAIYPNEDVIGSYSRQEAKYRLGDFDADDVVKHNAHRLFGAYLASVFSSRVVDKYPELIFRVPFVKAIFPDAKFLFLVRNGWDTCASIENWSGRLGAQQNGERHDWWGADQRKWNLLLEQIVAMHDDLAPHVDSMRGWTSQTDMAAVEWIVSMREGLKLEAEYTNDVLRVSYEALCHDPRKTMKQVAEFADLANDEIFLQYAQKVLKPTDQAPSFSLDQAIGKAFSETMDLLGYER